MTARTTLTVTDFEALISPLEIPEFLKAPLVEEFSKKNISVTEGSSAEIKVLQHVDSIYSEFVIVGVKHKFTSIVLKAERVKGTIPIPTTESEEIEALREDIRDKEIEIENYDEDEYEDEDTDEETLRSELNQLRTRLQTAIEAAEAASEENEAAGGDGTMLKPITVHTVDMFAKANELKEKSARLDLLSRTVPQEIELYRGFYPMGIEVQ